MTSEKTASGEEWALPGMEALKADVDPPEGCIQAEGSWRVAVPGSTGEDDLNDVTLNITPAGVLSFYDGAQMIAAYPPGGWIRVHRVLQ